MSCGQWTLPTLLLRKLSHLSLQAAGFTEWKGGELGPLLMPRSMPCFQTEQIYPGSSEEVFSLSLNTKVWSPSSGTNHIQGLKVQHGSLWCHTSIVPSSDLRCQSNTHGYRIKKRTWVMVSKSKQRVATTWKETFSRSRVSRFNFCISYLFSPSVCSGKKSSSQNAACISLLITSASCQVFFQLNVKILH